MLGTRPMPFLLRCVGEGAPFGCMAHAQRTCMVSSLARPMRMAIVIHQLPTQHHGGPMVHLTGCLAWVHSQYSCRTQLIGSGRSALRTRPAPRDVRRSGGAHNCATSASARSVTGGAAGAPGTCPRLRRAAARRPVRGAAGGNRERDGAYCHLRPGRDGEVHRHLAGVPRPCS